MIFPWKIKFHELWPFSVKHGANPESFRANKSWNWPLLYEAYLSHFLHKTLSLCHLTKCCINAGARQSVYCSFVTIYTTFSSVTYNFQTESVYIFAISKSCSKQKKAKLNHKICFYSKALISVVIKLPKNNSFIFNKVYKKITNRKVSCFQLIPLFIEISSDWYCRQLLPLFRVHRRFLGMQRFVKYEKWLIYRNKLCNWISFEEMLLIKARNGDGESRQRWR